MTGALTKISLLLALTLTISASSRAGNDLTVSGSDFRVIHGTLLKPDGSPAVGRAVRLHSLERHNLNDASDERKNWNFITDRRGQFTVKILNRDLQGERADYPDFGTYHLVAAPADDDAGAVSPRLTTREKDRWRPNEWGIATVIPENGMALTLRLQRGVTVSGRVVDYENPERPLSGVKVSVEHDLHVDTHTGYGGEIFRVSGTTDRRGEFTLRRVYPAGALLRIDANWLKTKADGQWVAECIDKITLSPDRSRAEIFIMASKKDLFRYSGTVTDADSGKPVVSATVVTWQSYHRQPLTYADDHHYPETLTNADGVFVIFLSTPWVRGMDVKKDGWQRVDLEAENQPLPPGVYNFKLTAATAR